MSETNQPEWLQVGAHCATRGGDRVRVLCTDRANLTHPVVSMTDNGFIMAHEITGKHLRSEGSSDLVGPWVDVIDWPWHLIPPWFKWCAFNEDGEAFAYRDTRQPKIKQDLRFSNSGATLYIPRAYAPPYKGSWETSLTERPQ